MRLAFTFRSLALSPIAVLLDEADHLKKGGPTYSYRVEFTPVHATTTVTIPKVGLFSQERQTVVVPRGNRFATLMSAGRGNWGVDEGRHVYGEDLFHSDTVRGHRSSQVRRRRSSAGVIPTSRSMGWRSPRLRAFRSIPNWPQTLTLGWRRGYPRPPGGRPSPQQRRRG